MIIKFLAKVLLPLPEQMEAEESYDLGKLQGRKWVYRNLALPVEEVYKITEYKVGSTSLVELNGGENILVKEKFDDLFDRWHKIKRELYEATDEEIVEEDGTEKGETEGDEEDE